MTPGSGCRGHPSTPPTSHEFHIVLGVKTQDPHTQIQSSSHPQEENAQFIQLNPGLNTFGPSKEKLLPPRGGWGNWPLWEFFPRQVVEGSRQCQTG